jgi:hypothetical protein
MAGDALPVAAFEPLYCSISVAFFMQLILASILELFVYYF